MLTKNDSIENKMWMNVLILYTYAQSYPHDDLRAIQKIYKRFSRKAVKNSCFHPVCGILYP